MIRYTVLLFLQIVAFFGFAQTNHPVSWKLDVEEIEPLTYRVNIHATIKSPYHIYPQQSSGGGIGMPTEIKFSDDAAVEFVGQIEEKGEEDDRGKKVAHYAKGVTFSQVVRLKTDKTVTLAVQVKSMACNDFMCMPPSTKKFSVTINGDEQDGQDAADSSVAVTANKRVLRYEDFEMADLEGQVVFSKDITTNSKYTFIDFWASWCAPCRAQGRELIPLYDKYKSKGFEVIGVSLDTKPEAWKKAVQQDGYTWVNLSDLKGFDSPLVKKYDINAIPRNFIVDHKGTIVAMDIHGAALETKLQELFGN